MVLYWPRASECVGHTYMIESGKGEKIKRHEIIFGSLCTHVCFDLDPVKHKVTHTECCGSNLQ
jgi:hypothetical protein